MQEGFNTLDRVQVLGINTSLLYTDMSNSPFKCTGHITDAVSRLYFKWCLDIGYYIILYNSRFYLLTNCLQFEHTLDTFLVYTYKQLRDKP